jgi:hypothetical protein
MTSVGVLLCVLVLAFGAVGWWADGLARNPSQTAGLAWGAVLFGVPFVVWLAIALIYNASGHHGDTEWGASGIFGLGYVISVGATLAGEVVGRAVHVFRRRLRVGR